MLAPRTVLLLSLRIGAVACVLAHATPSLADLVPPPGDCQNKKEGDPCKEDGKEGSCGTITSTATNNATNPPTSSQRSYFGCRVGTAPTTPATSAKKCSVGVVGAPVSGVGALVGLAFAVAAIGRRRQRA